MFLERMKNIQQLREKMKRALDSKQVHNEEDKDTVMKSLAETL